MPLDLNDPEVKAAIEAEATKIAEETVSENYVPVSDIEGLKNKNSELLSKIAKNKEKFSGLDESDLAELQRVKKAREHDQFVDMVLKGKTEEAKAMLTEGVINPWKQKTDDLTTQFNTAQEEINRYKGELEQATNKMTDMKKRQYLRELTSKDDSFKADHFDDFYMLNSSRIEIDHENGNVYALDNGNPVLDTEGKRVSYSDFYDKQKVSSGLFWTGGSGSGAKGIGTGNGTGLPKDPFSWTPDQKKEFITQNGPEAFGKVLSEWNRSQR